MGEVRAALVAAAREHGPCQLRQLVQHACVGYESARYSIANAVRSGDLVIVGHEKAPHAKRWVALYEAKPDDGPDTENNKPAPGIVLLTEALGGWARHDSTTPPAPAAH